MTSITIGKPSLPELDRLIPYLEKIWQSGIVTNGGQFHHLLEEKIAAYLDVPFVTLVNNGTIALQMALKALDVTGEVITTPFSFAATSQSIEWVGCTPVFADIAPGSFNISPADIEKKITSKTTAILAVHCYGIPCQTEEIDRIARQHGLKVIYDAAHAFGVKSASHFLTHGDLSVVSLHATKIFHTIEGGLIISRTAEQKRKLNSIRNFGLNLMTGEVEFCGTNGKLNEISAAIGLLNLETLDEHIQHRKQIYHLYHDLLAAHPDLKPVIYPAQIESNYQYFPVISLKKSAKFYVDLLRKHHILSRRYFFPLLTQQTADLPAAVNLAEHVFCLPIHSEMTMDDARTIATLLNETDHAVDF